MELHELDKAAIENEKKNQLIRDQEQRIRELEDGLTAIVSCYGVGYKSADQFVKDVEVFMYEAKQLLSQKQ